MKIECRDMRHDILSDSKLIYIFYIIYIYMILICGDLTYPCEEPRHLIWLPVYWVNQTKTIHFQLLFHSFPNGANLPLVRRCPPQEAEKHNSLEDILIPGFLGRMKPVVILRA